MIIYILEGIRNAGVEEQQCRSGDLQALISIVIDVMAAHEGDLVIIPAGIGDGLFAHQGQVLYFECVEVAYLPFQVVGYAQAFIAIEVCDGFGGRHCCLLLFVVVLCVLRALVMLRPLVLLRAIPSTVFALVFQHPAGIFGVQFADGVQLFQFGGV